MNAHGVGVGAAVAQTEQTQWRARGMRLPGRGLLRTESASATVLLASVLLALLWANLAPGSYAGVWRTELALELGDHALGLDLREWVNSGLMTLFFLVVGLEARREVDLGELRDRKRVVLPLVAGLAGMALPVAIYAAVNHGGPGAAGWGVAMSTDTALALGLLTFLRTGVTDRVRVFLVTVLVVDDLVALLVIAVFYSDSVDVASVAVAVLVLGLFLLMLRVGVDQPLAYAVMGVALWAALLRSGVDPVVAGLAIGLAGSAYTPDRGTLEAASGLFRRFREEPTAELARTASVGLIGALSPNARLQRFYLPWTSFVIVPVFGLANAGVPLDAGSLGRALTSPITLGIVAAYVVGKPVAVLAATWSVTRLSGGRVRPPVGWAAVAGSGTLAGTAFTVSLLIATLAFTGDDLTDAKIGVLATSALAVALTWVVFRATRRLPPARRARALLGTSRQLVDLADPVDPAVDHVRGATRASVTLVEYGDFECPNCGEAEPSARAELADDQDLRFVWRHLPLTDVHPRAELAAEAAEAAGSQGRFWEMHDLLLDHQEDLTPRDLVGYAERLGLDTDAFLDELRHHVHADRVALDVASADRSGVSGTPTFFVNGRRHHGAYDAASLRAAIKVARVRRAAGLDDDLLD